MKSRVIFETFASAHATRMAQAWQAWYDKRLNDDQARPKVTRMKKRKGNHLSLVFKRDTGVSHLYGPHQGWREKKRRLSQSTYHLWKPIIITNAEGGFAHAN